MHIRLIALALGLALASALAADEIKIYQIIPQDMLADKNPVRYSAANLVDGRQDTVYAVPRGKLSPGNPFLRFLFADPVDIDGVALCSGFFDQRYYRLNSRPAALRFVRLYKGKEMGQATVARIRDSMEEQRFDFGDARLCSELDVYLTDVYPGEKWNDVVISELSFWSAGKRLVPEFAATGKNAYSAFGHLCEYKGKLLEHELFQYGKAASEDRYYLYNYDGRIAVELRLEMDSQCTVQYVYKHPEDQHPSQQILTAPDGTVTEKVDFLYKDDRLVEETHRLGQEFTKKYYYDSTNLVRVELSYPKSPDFDSTTEYFYADGRVSAEEEIKPKDRSRTVYQYLYQGDLPTIKLAVLSFGYGTDSHGLQSYPETMAFYARVGNASSEESGSFHGDW